MAAAARVYHQDFCWATKSVIITSYLLLQIILPISKVTALSSSSNGLPSDIRQAILGKQLPKESLSPTVTNSNEGIPTTATYQIHPILSKNDRSRNADAPDEYFYSYPMMVQHNDDVFRDKLSQLYGRLFQSLQSSNNDGSAEKGSVFLDLGSSWVSHLPSKYRPREVWLHGMNREELERNPDATGYRIVKSFNDADEAVNKALLSSSSSAVSDSSSIQVSSSSDLLLPEIPSESVDVIGACATFQYWQYPERVVGEALRLLKPNDESRIVISFSDRMFESKATNAWKTKSLRDRVKYVKCMLEHGAKLDDGSKFVVEETVMDGATLAALTMPFAMAAGKRVIGGDPFLAVIATKRKSS